MMIRMLICAGILALGNSPAAPSSIDALGLPQAPSTRYDLKKVENVDREAEQWYLSYSYYEENGERVTHGIRIDRVRSRDRERHATDYVETRRLYHDGEASRFTVVSTWVEGVLRQREYHLTENLVITLNYNSRGQLMRGPRQNARGGRAKRERITNVFDSVFQLSTP